MKHLERHFPKSPITCSNLLFFHIGDTSAAKSLLMGCSQPLLVNHKLWPASHVDILLMKFLEVLFHSSSRGCSCRSLLISPGTDLAVNEKKVSINRPIKGCVTVVEKHRCICSNQHVPSYRLTTTFVWMLWVKKEKKRNEKPLTVSSFPLVLLLAVL